MLRIKDLQTTAFVTSLDELRRAVGPFALVQRPEAPLLAQRLAYLAAAMTITIPRAQASALNQELVALLGAFDDLVVATLPPVGSAAELSVGRAPECELCVHDPSVSKQHALLRWDAVQAGCSIQDLGSTNGTLVNTTELGREEVLLQDGDVVSFGNAQFVYLLAQTLQEQLRASHAFALKRRALGR